MAAKNPVKTLSASSAAAWMERLRAKSSSYRSAADLSRSTRATLLDRRNAPDAADRVVLRASLDQVRVSFGRRSKRPLGKLAPKKVTMSLYTQLYQTLRLRFVNFVSKVSKEIEQNKKDFQVCTTSSC